MRVFARLLGVVCVLGGAAAVSGQTPARPGGPPAQPPSQASIETATKVLADARKALGGEAKQGAIKNFVATGRTRRVSGDNLVPVEFEIDVEMPDKYVRKDEIPAQESAPSSNGFNGDNLIQVPPPVAPPPAAPGRPGGPGDAAGPGGPATTAGAGRPGMPAMPAMTPQQQQDAMRKARVVSLKQDFARLILGMFAMSPDAYPLTFSYVGQAEAPQGKADVINVSGPGNFTARLFVMSDTHLPIMLSWTTPATPANIVITTPGQPKPATLPPGAIVVEGPTAPPAGASKDQQDAYAKSLTALRQQALAGKTIENRLYYSDYRDSDGLQLPFRLRRAIGSDTIEETTFDRFRLNTKIDAKKFEPVK